MFRFVSDFNICYLTGVIIKETIPNSAGELYMPNQLVKLQECFKDIKSWTSSNFLLLNSDKTEVIVVCAKTQIHTFYGINLPCSKRVWRCNHISGPA